LNKVQEVGISSNMMLLVGHGVVRIAAMGFENREPNESELKIMKAHVREAMESGALGLSTGLLYPPGIFAKTEEIIELCKVVAEYNGYYFSHIRSYGGQLMKSMKEAIKIGDKAGVNVQISHISVFGKPFWGSSNRVLQLIEKSRTKGIEVNTDLHPYDSVMTDLMILLPPWAYEGGKKKTLERLSDPETREKIKHQQINGPENRDEWPEWAPIDLIGWENILIIMLKSEKYKQYEGKNMKEIADAENKDVYNALYDLLIEEEAEANMIITHLRGEEDIVSFIKSPLAAFETDATPTAPYGELSKGKPHPRGYGTYPRILGEFVREKKVISLETAIRKATSLPAQMVGILDRGLLKESFWADIVIFNSDTIIDKATYTNPHQYPEGIEYVIVNGEIVIEKGIHTEKLPGKVLRH
jgi:N-acyl-D-amino-acid deacylase